MKTSVYTFEVILKTFNDYSKDIQQSLWGKSFKSVNDRFDYICAIVGNHLNDTAREIERRRNQKEEWERFMSQSATVSSGGASIAIEQIKLHNHTT